MPPFVAAAVILASPVEYTRIPQASALPTLEPVAAGPADTGPFMLRVTGATTGPWGTAQPATRAAQDNASIRGFNMDISPSLTWLLARFAHTPHGTQSNSRGSGPQSPGP